MKRFSPIVTGVFLALAFTGYSFLQVNFNRAGWGDEFAFIDIAANYLTFGEWQAYNFTDVTWSLYTWLAVPWLAIFGIGHVSACSFNLAWFFLALLVLSIILVRRGIIKSHIGMVVLYLALWCNANFVWTVASGRYDMCALFLSILIADRLSTSDAQNAKTTRWLLALYMFVLMKTMVYTIPLLGFFGIMLLAFPPFGITRAEVFKRGVFCAFGATLGFAVNIAYNFSQHHLLYYFYNLFIHNAVISGHLEGSAETFPGCYIAEPYIIILFMAGIAVALGTRRLTLRIVPHLVFVILIPFLMIVAGRYAFYYHFVWLVPTAVFFAWACDHLESHVARLGILVLLSGWCGFSSFDWIAKHIDRPFVGEQDRFVKFMIANRDRYERGEPLLLFEEDYYYPAYALGLQPWRRREFDSLRHTTQSRIEELLAKKISNPRLRHMIMEFYDKHEKLPFPKLPESGLLITKTNESRKAYEAVLHEQGYDVEAVAFFGELALLRLDRRRRH